VQSTLEKKSVPDFRSLTTCQNSPLKSYNGSMDEPERKFRFHNSIAHKSSPKLLPTGHGNGRQIGFQQAIITKLTLMV